jgi:Tol biopolymer transport system component
VAVAEGRAAGPPSRVTHEPATDLFPVFVGDGSLIAFVRWGSGTPEVWLVAADGRQPARRLTRGADARFVRWDAGHRSLLVSGSWGGPTVSLRLVSLASGEVRNLERPVVFGPSSAIGDFDAAADGSFLAFVLEQTRGDIWLMEARP